MSKEMKVRIGILYDIGEFRCSFCGETHRLKCKPKAKNPGMKSNRHYVE